MKVVMWCLLGVLALTSVVVTLAAVAVGYHWVAI